MPRLLPLLPWQSSGAKGFDRTDQSIVVESIRPITEPPASAIGYIHDDGWGLCGSLSASQHAPGRVDTAPLKFGWKDTSDTPPALPSWLVSNAFDRKTPVKPGRSNTTPPNKQILPLLLAWLDWKKIPGLDNKQSTHIIRAAAGVPVSLLSPPL